MTKRRVAQNAWLRCVQRKILPTSYMLSEGPEQMTDCRPASGGFADIWPGTYNGSHVAMKILRAGNDDTVEKVSRQIGTMFIRIA